MNSSNSELILNYTEYLIKTQQECLRSLKIRLYLNLGLAVFLIQGLPVITVTRENTPFSIPDYLLLLNFFCLIVVIILSCSNLLLDSLFQTIDPTDLMNAEWYFAAKDDFRDYMISNQIQIISGYINVVNRLAKVLNLSIFFVGFSVFLSILQHIN